MLLGYIGPYYIDCGMAVASRPMSWIARFSSVLANIYWYLCPVCWKNDSKAARLGAVRNWDKIQSDEFLYLQDDTRLVKQR